MSKIEVSPREAVEGMSKPMRAALLAALLEDAGAVKVEVHAGRLLYDSATQGERFELAGEFWLLPAQEGGE